MASYIVVKQLASLESVAPADTSKQYGIYKNFAMPACVFRPASDYGDHVVHVLGPCLFRHNPTPVSLRER